MPTVYFNSMAAGGSGDGDGVNPLNYWQNSDNTIPNVVVSALTDDLVLQDILLLNGALANNVSDFSGTGANYIGGSATNDLQIKGTATGIVTNGGVMNGYTGSVFKPVTAVGCTFGSASGQGDINGSGGCTYNAAITANITDDAGNFAGINFTGATINLTNPASFDATGATAFSGNVAINVDPGSVAGPSTFPHANFSGILTAPSASQCSIAALVLDGTAPAYVDVPTLATMTTQMVVPSSVTDLAIYQAGGSGTKITGVTVPVIAEVLSGNTYGFTGTALNGDWQRPANVASDVLMKPHVKSGDLFGPVGNQQEGTFAGSGGGGNIFNTGIGIGIQG